MIDIDKVIALFVVVSGESWYYGESRELETR